MGGYGKTTLEKHIYNQKYPSIGRSSFIFDVRDVAAKGELHKKQIQLLQNLGFNCEAFDSVEQGKGILSNRLRSVRVLIILDDVDHTDQLDSLFPAKDSLGWGSLIIITTREKEVLKRWEICIYRMKPFNQIHAEKLFCWHAFLQPFPTLGFEKLVTKFLNVCHGLPLSLKLVGGQLYGCFRKDIWEDVLHKISKIIPNDIISRLKVSYDALDKEEKQMFLDMPMTAIAAWEGSGWIGLERLFDDVLLSLMIGMK
ncbi:hypothetical protein SUGI_0213640 [Cryptomeria japonica]|nr:hypothetical protein SUGI_0213640 [Cryptomeria japonica]